MAHENRTRWGETPELATQSPGIFNVFASRSRARDRAHQLFFDLETKTAPGLGSIRSGAVIEKGDYP